MAPLHPSTQEVSKKPWNLQDANIPANVYYPKGMIGPEERRAYFWLAQRWLTGRGCIVDAGSFVGASTFCLAAGAYAGGCKEFDAAPIVRSYDFFAVIDAYVGEAIQIERGAVRTLHRTL
jgi:hypothetical protein